MVVHTFNPSTWEANAGGFLSSRPSWSTDWVLGHPRLDRETLSQNKQTNKQTKITNNNWINNWTWLALLFLYYGVPGANLDNSPACFTGFCINLPYPVKQVALSSVSSPTELFLTTLTLIWSLWTDDLCQLTPLELQLLSTPLCEEERGNNWSNWFSYQSREITCQVPKNASSIEIGSPWHDW